MLQHVPAWLGALLAGRRAGHERLVVADPAAVGAAPMIALSSPAFAAGGRLPIRFTADGAGVSPPLTWTGLPEGTRSLALIVEDPDAPTPRPLVHAIVWDMPPDAAGLAEGAVAAGGGGGVGRNSALREGWMPPDPPTGHGEHDYVFQLFALSERIDVGDGPGRGALVEAIAGKVLAVGLLIGTYARDDPAADAIPAATGLAGEAGR